MDLCASRGIAPDVEVVGAGEMHRVYETLDAGNDAGKRFVLDVASLREDAAETEMSSRGRGGLGVYHSVGPWSS